MGAKSRRSLETALFRYGDQDLTPGHERVKAVKLSEAKKRKLAALIFEFAAPGSNGAVERNDNVTGQRPAIPHLSFSSPPSDKTIYYEDTAPPSIEPFSHP